MTNELKPCPFCGSNHVSFKSPVPRDWNVVCFGCGAMTGITKSNKKALKEWNTRHMEVINEQPSLVALDEVKRSINNV